MDDISVQLLRSHCCTCLSSDRVLFQLSRIASGINNLYALLSYDSEAYREGFFMDSANLFQCWECRALIEKFYKFRSQACRAQKTLSTIVERQETTSSKSLSRLSINTKTFYDQHFISTSEARAENEAITTTDNFIDCGSANIKSEPPDADDIPLSTLRTKHISDCINDTYLNRKIDQENEKSVVHLLHLDDVTNKKSVKLKKQSAKVKKKVVIENITSSSNDSDNGYYKTIELSEREMLASREQRKMTAIYNDASYKCDTCIEGFRLKVDYCKHNSAQHTERDKHTACDICRVYIENSALAHHRRGHYMRFNCKSCDYATRSVDDVTTHLKSCHAAQKVLKPRETGATSGPVVLKPGSKPRRNQATLDKRTPFGYLCVECNKYFDNKNKRWKHVQRQHREGFCCATCGKKFAFKNNLSRHEQLHSGVPSREECEVCHKMIRRDLLKAHSAIHTNRQSFVCAECDKTFVCRASYEHHLKYTKAHTTHDILKYKCEGCGRGYRSRGELRDHVNYQHRGATLHKCPVCNKALATRRCITRHVRRAHHGVRESARDKICQKCGKAFRDKNGLREHELIHTGERPLSCELCGASFRQSASLYTHRRRIHKIFPAKKTVELLTTE